MAVVERAGHGPRAAAPFFLGGWRSTRSMLSYSMLLSNGLTLDKLLLQPDLPNL